MPIVCKEKRAIPRTHGIRAHRRSPFTDEYSGLLPNRFTTELARRRTAAGYFLMSMVTFLISPLNLNGGL
jgi:hypothetical protein